MRRSRWKGKRATQDQRKSGRMGGKVSVDIGGAWRGGPFHRRAIVLSGASGIAWSPYSQPQPGGARPLARRPKYNFL